MEKKDIDLKEGNETIINESDVKKDEVVDELLNLTKEELVYNFKEAKGYAERLRKQIKEIKSKAEKPAQTKTEDNTLGAQFSTKDLVEIAKLSTQYSVEEIEEAKKFVGTPLGNSLSEVMNSAGFKAEIELKKEKEKSNDVMDIQDISIAPIETKNSIIRDIEEGRIDINDKANAKYRKIYVEHLASK